MCDYQESVTIGQTDTDGQTPDKVIPMCCFPGDTKIKYPEAYGELNIMYIHSNVHTQLGIVY